jgi:hypothetical protein
LPYQVYKHEDYVEVRLEGVIESALPLVQLAEDDALVLVDYAGVTEVVADTYELARQARLAEEAGLKVAVYAPRPALFGLNRQALQLGLVSEGVSSNVFTDRDEAQAWLHAG